MADKPGMARSFSLYLDLLRLLAALVVMLAHAASTKTLAAPLLPTSTPLDLLLHLLLLAARLRLLLFLLPLLLLLLLLPLLVAGARELLPRPMLLCFLGHWPCACFTKRIGFQ